jgi:hypothetical protein
MRPDIALALVLVTALGGAGTAAQSSAACAPWTPPPTSDGQPDLQSTWTNTTITPLEPPATEAARDDHSAYERDSYEFMSEDRYKERL